MTARGGRAMIRHKRVQPVVFQPAAGPAVQRGMRRIVDVVRATLGPIPRLVAIEQTSRSRMPELLDNAALTARRIIQLPDRDEDVGAMFVRHMLWRLYEETGDGTATAAVLFQSIYDQGLRHIAAGGNAQLLRQHLERGLSVILDDLTAMATPVRGKATLARVAETICGDAPLAAMLGEIFDLVGEYGQLDVRAGEGRGLEREYVEGMWWTGGLLSAHMATDTVRLRAEVETPSILISDLAVDDPHVLVPIMEAALQAGRRSLVIVATRFSDSALSLLLTNRERTGLNTIAVSTPGTTVDEQAAALADLAIATGGRPFMAATGDSLRNARLSDLGSARRFCADQRFFGIVAGGGDAHAVRRHITALRHMFQASDQSEARLRLRQRIGRFMGGSATLWVGGMTEPDILARKELARRTGDALRGALAGGVVPGGGAALIACCPALRHSLEQSSCPDERAAYRILLRAMEEPARTIITNAGYDAAACMAESTHAGPGYGVDVRSGQVVDLTRSGIVDVATVVKAAVRSAVTGAALALTIDVLIHTRKRQAEVTP